MRLDNHGLTPLKKKGAKVRLSEVQIFKDQKRFFSVEMIPNHYFKMIFAQTPKMQKVLLFDQNHGLTPLENMPKCDYLKCIFS